MTEVAASMKNTKKEMLEIIDRLQKELEAKEKDTLNPEKVKQEKQKAETIKKADQAADSDLSTQIHTLKLSISKELTNLADTIQAEAEKYDNLNRAIELKKRSLNHCTPLRWKQPNSPPSWKLSTRPGSSSNGKWLTKENNSKPSLQRSGKNWRP